MTKWSLPIECKAEFDTKQLINEFDHINRINQRNHMIISIDIEKVFGKKQHPFMIKKRKNSQQTVIGKNFNQIQSIYEKSIGKIVLNSERLKVFL